MVESCDVIILGGAFSGAALGFLLKRVQPEWRVIIVERREEFDRKVGESTSEVAGCFITKVLHCQEYLARHQLIKHGLRLWFHNDGNECFTQCTEVGSVFQSRLPTYQLDRGNFDTYLLQRAVDAGCELIRPGRVKDCEIQPDGTSTVTVEQQGIITEFTTRWFADASGKATFLARKMKLLQEKFGQPTNSIWARFENVRSFEDADIQSRYPEFTARVKISRTSATNHLCGRGWWCWIIPLHNGQVSLGLTWDPRLFTPAEAPSIQEKLLHHALTTPIGRLLFRDAVAVTGDARAYSHLSYVSQKVAGPGWCMVGDAAGFMDPLYSQGLDYCAHTVYRCHAVIVQALASKDATELTDQLNREFQTSYHRWYRALYLDKYRYLGDAKLMHIAYLMDLAAYFIGPVRTVYTQPDAGFKDLPYLGGGGAFFSWFMACYNRRLAKLSDKRLSAGVATSHNNGHYWLIPKGYAPNTSALRPLFRGLWLWFCLEISSLLLRPKKAQIPTVQST